MINCRTSYPECNSGYYKQPVLFGKSTYGSKNDIQKAAYCYARFTAKSKVNIELRSYRSTMY